MNSRAKMENFESEIQKFLDSELLSLRTKLINKFLHLHTSQHSLPDISCFTKSNLCHKSYSDLFKVTINGDSGIRTRAEMEEIHKNWKGHFLLNIHRRRLVIQHDGKPQKIQLGGKKGIPWAHENILIVGMSKPGRAFGHNNFPSLSHYTKTLTSYVSKLNRKISPKNNKVIKRTLVEPELSDTGWGYYLDLGYEYLVIQAVKKT